MLECYWDNSRIFDYYEAETERRERLSSRYDWDCDEEPDDDDDDEGELLWD